MVLGTDAATLGGAVANSGGWLKASDETHCGKMVALQVRRCYSSEAHMRIKWPFQSAMCNFNFMYLPKSEPHMH
jgi:hypothetical protein